MSPVWHDAVDRPRTFYTLQNARQEPCKHRSDRGEQVSSLPDISQQDITICLLQTSAFSIIWHCG